MMHEVGAGATKLAPLAVMSGFSFLGFRLGEWMYIASIVYAILQSAYLIWRWVREARDPRRAARDGDA